MLALPITMLAGAAAVLLNIWLGARIARHRVEFKVSVGDGGHEPLLRRMRAQANFIEQAPFFLILLAALEVGGANRLALGIVSSLFVVARIAHGIGMDGGPLHRWRAIGISLSILCSLVLAGWAVARAIAALG